MIFTKKNLALFFTQCFLVLLCQGQLSKNTDKLAKWGEKYEGGVLKVSPVVLPSYNPDIGASAVIGLLSTFKTKRNNPYLNHSYLPVVLNTDFKENHIFSADLYSLFYDDLLMINIQSIYHNREDHYFGIAYSESSSINKGENTTKYNLNMVKFSPEVLFRVYNSLYAGLVFNYNSTQAKEISPLMKEDPLLLEQGTEIENVGTGFSLKYSNLNLEHNSSLAELNASFLLFGSLISGPHTYKKWLFNYKHRFLIFSRDRLILTVKSENNFGNVPWTDMAFLGGENNLLGLPLGKYRDKSSVQGNIEYRYALGNNNTNKVLRHNLLFQFGGGSVYGEPNSESPVIINMALGYLFKYQPDYFMSIYGGFAEKSFGIYLKFDKVL